MVNKSQIFLSGIVLRAMCLTVKVAGTSVFSRLRGSFELCSRPCEPHLTEVLLWLNTFLKATIAPPGGSAGPAILRRAGCSHTLASPLTSCCSLTLVSILTYPRCLPFVYVLGSDSLIHLKIKIC